MSLQLDGYLPVSKTENDAVTVFTDYKSVQRIKSVKSQ